jgi:hypothetical protein
MNGSNRSRRGMLNPDAARSDPNGRRVVTADPFTLASAKAQNSLKGALGRATTLEHSFR